MPNNAVHVPGDVWAGVTRQMAEAHAAICDGWVARLDALVEQQRVALNWPKDWTTTILVPERIKDRARWGGMAAALRRLAPYLPSEAPQEAVQPPCDVEPGE